MFGKKQEIKKFSELEPQRTLLEGRQCKIDEIVGKSLVITKFEVFNSKFVQGAKYCMIQAKLNDELIVFTTMSRVVMEQLERHKEDLPFIATVLKRGRYYLLV